MRMRPVDRLLAAREALSGRGKIDWQKLNHILIPLPVARKTERRKLPLLGRALLSLYAIFTPEGRAFFVVVVLVGVFGVDVYRTQIYLLSNVLFGVLAGAIIAALVQRRVRATMTLSVPSRVSVGQRFDVDLTLTCETKATPGAVRLGRPFLPYFARWAGPSPWVSEWSENGQAKAHLPITFDRRGDFTLDSLGAYEVAPFGLTQKRIGESAQLSVRVVPRTANVVSLRTPLATKHQPGGVALASKTGESMELMGVRDYRRGDRLRDISARAWARTGKPAVREYREEYFSRIGVFLDTDESIFGDVAFEAAIELCAGVVSFLSRGEALIDLLVAGERFQTMMLGRSLGYMEQALDFLATVEKSPPFDREALLARVAPQTEQLSCAVVIAGEFGDNQQALARELEARGVRVVRIMVRDADDVRAKVASAGNLTLDAAAIRRGEPLAL